MSQSNYLELELLDHVWGNSAYTAPATVYVSAHTADPTDAGTGTEVSGGSYARVAVTNNTTNFPLGVNPKLLATVTTFTQATADWGTVSHFAVWDALASGNMLVFGALSTSQLIVTGNTLSIPANEVSIAAD